MNLRDRLRAVHGGSAGSPAGDAAITGSKNNQAARVCWERDAALPLPPARDLAAISSETLRLMTDEVLPDRLQSSDILFLDTETTGLGGGAGTVAFEIGLGREKSSEFSVRQLFMRDYPEEPAMLKRLQELTEPFRAICTFNGSTFDLPLLRTRFLMNRMKPDCLDKPHIDLLHMARRIWRARLGRCNLTRLEELVLGMPRTDDMPGSEAPERYFSFLRTSDFSYIEPVLRHNESDVWNLEALLARMCRLYICPEELDSAQDALSMGVALERMRHPNEARRCYRLVFRTGMRLQGQIRLAQNLRRAGERPQAAQIWTEMIERREGGIHPYIELAKYEEHVLRDERAALEHTKKAIVLLAEPSLRDPDAVQSERNALQYRYDRLRRKLAAKGDDDP